MTFHAAVSVYVSFLTVALIASITVFRPFSTILGLAIFWYVTVDPVFDDLHVRVKCGKLQACVESAIAVDERVATAMRWGFESSRR